MKKNNPFVTPSFSDGITLKEYLVKCPFDKKDKGFIVKAASQDKAIQKVVKAMVDIQKKEGGELRPFEITHIGKD